MEGSCQGVLAALVVVAGLAAFGSSYQIIEGPKNATVLVGQEARFNCTISGGWSLIMWALKGTVVLSVTPMGVIITSNHFTSQNYTAGDDFTSEMIIHDVQPSDAGHIKCSLQNSVHEGSAFLSVQVVGELLVHTDSYVVTEDEPCNVTCRAVGWNPLPELSWEIGVPVSDSSFHSVLEPDDPPSVLSILTLTPRGSGNLTCVAKMKGLQARHSFMISLTVAPPHSDALLPTWAIALLTVSFLLLFILIMVLIILFCRCVSRREKPESSTLKKAADVETNQETFEPKLKGGNENYGYSAESASSPAKSPGPSLPAQQSSRPQSSRPQSSRQPQHVTKQATKQVTKQVTKQATKPEPKLHQQAPTSRPHPVSPRVTRNVTLV